MTAVATKYQQPVRSTIPARLDRLRWLPFHSRLVLGLGTAWILDGLEITIARSVTSKLTQANTLNLSTAQAASIGTVYLVGEVVGALVFGRLSDKLGRRNLFMWTLAIYLISGSVLAFSAWLFGTIFYSALIGTGSNRAGLTIGYLIGGGVMIIGGLSGASSASTPRASRWSRSRDRSPKSVLGATCHDAPSTPSGRYAMTGITLAAALARDSSRQVVPADNRRVVWA